MAVESETPSFSSTTHCFLNLSDSLTLQVFSSTYPRNLKIADLQKGLVLSYNGVYVNGEGTGFGLPIAQYSDETVFPGSALLNFRKRGNVVEIQKTFFMDLIARDGFLNIKFENLRIRRLIDYVSVLYQRHRFAAKSILTVKPLLYKFGVKSRFIKSQPRGTVKVNYILDQKRLLVKLDSSQLNRINLKRVFVLNEQSAHFFRTYLDSDGVKLVDEEIGVWENVTAKSAKIVDEREKIGFSLKNLKGANLRRGRELMQGSLDWIGLDYEFEPECGIFEYEIELFG
jgi:hypothetical protein